MKRDEIIQTITSKTKLTIPKLLIEHEFDHFLEDRNTELENLGMRLDDYLKQIKKTEKELADEERAAIEARVRTSLVFQKIRNVENITASPREIADEMTILKRQHPNSDLETLRRTAEATIAQEKIFKLFAGENS